MIRGNIPAMKTRINPIRSKRGKGRPAVFGTRKKARSIALSDDAWACVDGFDESRNLVIDRIIRESPEFAALMVRKKRRGGK